MIAGRRGGRKEGRRKGWMGVVMEGGSGGQDHGLAEGSGSKVALLKKDQAAHTYRELCILEYV